MYYLKSPPDSVVHYAFPWGQQDQRFELLEQGRRHFGDQLLQARHSECLGDDAAGELNMDLVSQDRIGDSSADRTRQKYIPYPIDDHPM